MKVTVCQFDPRPEALDENLLELVAHVKENGSDFLLLPEMCFSGWLAAEETPDPQKWQAAVTAHAQKIAGLASARRIRCRRYTPDRERRGQPAQPGLCLVRRDQYGFAAA